MNGGRQGAEAPYRGVTSIRGRFAIGGLGGGGGHGSFGGDVGHFLSLSQRKGELLTFLAVFSYQKVQKKKKEYVRPHHTVAKSSFLFFKSQFLVTYDRMQCSCLFTFMTTFSCLFTFLSLNCIRFFGLNVDFCHSVPVGRRTLPSPEFEQET